MNKIDWPYGKKFAFTIIDDTDNSYINNIEPVYEWLYKNGLLTTKTVWVYSTRDSTLGTCLHDEKYSSFIKDLNTKGFEIGLHNVGSGNFNRDEIKIGLEWFKGILGFYPKIQINHKSNPDNIYWGSKRFIFPINLLYKLIYGNKKDSMGDKHGSNFFWGDICKTNIKYIRNHVFYGINTRNYDPKSYSLI